jgi:hypothetical protein
MPHDLPSAGCIQLVSNDEAWIPGQARNDRRSSDIEQSALALSDFMIERQLPASAYPKAIQLSRDIAFLDLRKNAGNLPKVTVKSEFERFAHQRWQW